MDTKGKRDSHRAMLGDANPPLTSMDRCSRRKINEETVALNVTLDQIDLMGIFRLIKISRTHTIYIFLHRPEQNPMDHSLIKQSPF